MEYSIEEFGTCFSSDYRLYFKNKSTIVSPFHDIPLFHEQENAIFNMVVEIPRWTNAKMEISTKDKMNPIKQDVKKGNVRFVKNSFPYKGYMWNYGAFPQTWEDPNEIDQYTNQKGDGDPIDVIDVGYKVSYRGEVKQVKVLGIMAMIDEGETDWKVIAIDINDPLASKLSDIEDVHTHMPGLIEATREWFRTYKMPGSDAPPNEFAFSGKAKNKSFAMEIIMQTHDHWKKLITKGVDNVAKVACENVLVQGSPYKISEESANDTKDLPKLTSPASLPQDVDMMYYLTAERKMGISPAPN